jgi:amidophosphoribosyltransferase
LSTREDIVCGIVGLQLRDDSLVPRLGALLTGMLAAVNERGPDSAGIGIYQDSTGPTISVLTEGGRLDPALQAVLTDALGAPVIVEDWDGGGLITADALPSAEADQSRLTAAGVTLEKLLAVVRDAAPQLRPIGTGEALRLFKGTGLPSTLCRTFDIASRSGYQGIGHTRMATESAVTVAHSHPFVTAPDLCLVHNGSFSNHNTIRRRLRYEGAVFDTDNDSEVAARYIAHALAGGDDLATALKTVLATFDGFFTLLVTTATEFAVVRDRFSCKPAVIAETPAYVAMASEYRALAELPGIESATVFEPDPEEVLVWTR